MNLISKDATVSQQLQQRYEFVEMISKWKNGYTSRYINPRIDLEQLQEYSGVKCYFVGCNLAGFEVVDSAAYVMFVLKWK